jgi:heavy metal sensor kinase
MISLRVRLTLWYCAVLLVAVVAFEFVVFAVVRDRLLRHHDPSLARTAAAVEAVLRQHEDCAHLTPEQRQELDSIGRLVLLHDISGRGELFYRSPDSTAFPVPFPLVVDPEVLRRPAWFETHDSEVGPIRVLSWPYQSHAGRAGLIRVMDPIGDVDEPLRAARRALLISLPFALAMAAGGGWFLAHRALRPVDVVTRRAREIEAGQLSRRLPHPGTQDEIGRLVDTLNEMIARLEASFEGMRRFTADASHEMRSPLATMRSTVDLALSRGREPAEYREALASVGEEIDRLRAIVEDLLTLARADAGRMPLRREPVRLEVLAADVVESLRPVAQERGATLRLVADVSVEISGDERWLRQLLVNLVGNALKFGVTPESAAIEVEVARRDGSAVMCVRDEGPGLPEGELARIFERFHRADPARSRERIEGVGLGLSIARWVAESHGGTITARNRAPHGLEVVVALPLA